MKKTLKITGISIVILIIVGIAGMFAMGVTPLSFGMHDNIQNNNGIAVDGYDVVSYFKQKKAIKGSDDFVTDWNGLTWKFSSAENLEVFTNTPEEYSPCYGGYCAFAIGKGFAAPGNPEFWAVTNGRLLFFADDAVKADAIADIDNILATGDKSWK